MFALATVLQHRQAAVAPASGWFGARLVVSLARRPLWVAGVGADGLGFAMQWLALQRGALVVVQVLLLTGLLFALVIEAVAARRVPRGAELPGALLVVAGVVAFLSVAKPRGGIPYPSTPSWALTAILVVVPGLAAALVHRQVTRRRGVVRSVPAAVALAGAAGLLYAISAALTKVTAETVSSAGVLAAAASLAPWALVGAGAWSLALTQTAFQSGPLQWSLPTLSVVDPLASLLIGIGAFHERLAAPRSSDAWLAGLGLAIALAGAVLLARYEAGTASPPGPGAVTPPGPDDGER